MTSSHTPRLPIQAPEGIKSPVATATIDEIDLEGLQIINGYQLNVNDRVLVKDQTNLANNGIYSAQKGAWVRAKDWKVSQQVANGVLVLDNNTSVLWRANFAGVLNIGITDVTFSNVTSKGSLQTFVQEEKPVGPIIEGARWYIPSKATTYVFYYDESGDGVWVEEPVAIVDQAINGAISFESTQDMIDGVFAITGQLAFNRERDNAPYVLAPQGYVAKVGDVVSSGGRVWELQISNGSNVAWFGDNVGQGNDDTLAIQAALDRGGYVYSRNMTHVVSRSGVSSHDGRGYCLSVGSDTTIDFASSKITNLAALADTDILISQGGYSYENITVKNMTIDGKAVPNDSSKKGFCLWFRGVTNLRLENVNTVNSRSWGTRIQNCDKVQLNGTDANHGANINADGIHFIDTNNVVGSNVNIYTEGDDGFIIEALYSDVSDYNISGLNVEANVQVSAAGRGVFIFQEEDINPAVLEMRNIRIDGVVKNCKGGAFVTAGALGILNMNIDISSSGCEYGMYLQYGSVSTANQGSIRNSRFKGLISDTSKNGFLMNPLNSSVAEMCDFDIRIVNPADGFTGATVKGREHTGSFVVDYDPLNDKISHGNGVQLDTVDSSLYVMSKGANNNLRFADNAQGNNVRIGNLKDAVVSDVSASPSVSCFENNVFGGSITTLTQNGALRNRFYNTRGAVFEGRAQLTPDGSGRVLVPHGLPAAPRRTQVTAESSSVMANVVGADSTNITLEIRGFGGALITSGSYRVNIQTQVDF